MDKIDRIRSLVRRQRELYYKRYGMKKFIDLMQPYELGFAGEGNAFLMRVSLDDKEDKIQDFILLHRPDDGMSYERVNDMIIDVCKNDCYRIRYLTIIDIDTYVSPNALIMYTDFNPYIEFYQAYQYWLWEHDDLEEACQLKK